MRTVYVETTIPSFYFSSRRSAQAVAWRNQTRAWWKAQSNGFSLVTSIVVIQELNKAPGRMAAPRLRLIRDLPLLELDAEVERIAAYYTQHRLMPSTAELDAVHVALASYHGADFLLTWNCRHLANANKSRHLSVLNRRLGLPVPMLLTPYNLTSEDEP